MIGTCDRLSLLWKYKVCLKEMVLNEYNNITITIYFIEFADITTQTFTYARSSLVSCVCVLIQM